MLPELRVGHFAELAITVGGEHAIELGAANPGGGVAVFSTPAMINLMEYTARAALAPFLEPGEESVGVRIQVEHLAATPVGAAARAVARVLAVEGRMIDFEIEAFDHAELIGRGTHRRAVIHTQKFAQRVMDKASQQPDADMSPIRLPLNAGPLPAMETLLVRSEGPVATVTLNRPQQRNAVNRKMTDEWEQLIGWLAGHKDIRVVVVTGAGEAFCAGDDVKEVAGLTLEEARGLSLRQARMYLAFEQLPQVMIAAVNGAALGAGCVCAYSCDFRIASHAAQFGMPEVRLGWPPGYGMAQLTALVGKARALELCLTGKHIGAAQAADYGLVHEVVAQARLLPSAQELAQQLLALPASALSMTKRIIHADEGTRPKLAYLLDTAAYIRCLGTADAREGMAAFREKRPPRFTGS